MVCGGKRSVRHSKMSESDRTRRPPGLATGTALVNSPRQIFRIYHAHSQRRVKVKFRLVHRHILPPIAEAKLRLRVPRAREPPRAPGDIPGQPQKVSAGSPNYLRFRQPSARGMQFKTTLRGSSGASPDTPIGATGRCDQLDLSAQPVQMNFAGQQSQRRTPIVALLQFRPARGAIGGHVEPNIHPIDQKQFRRRRFILPAHPPRLRKINRPGFRLPGLPGGAIPFIELGFERVRPRVTGFHGVDDFRNGLRCVGKNESKQKCDAKQIHETSLTGCMLARKVAPARPVAQASLPAFLCGDAPNDDVRAVILALSLNDEKSPQRSRD